MDWKLEIDTIAHYEEVRLPSRFILAPFIGELAIGVLGYVSL